MGEVSESAGDWIAGPDSANPALQVIRTWSALAWADGVIAPAEAAAMNKLIDSAQLSLQDSQTARGYLVHPVALSDVDLDQLSHTARSRIYRAAVKLAHVDQNLAPAERHMLNRLREGLDLDAIVAEQIETERDRTPASAFNLGSLLRLAIIMLVGLGCVLVYAALRLSTLLIFDSSRRRCRVNRIRGLVLRWYLQTLGATFIKLGQVLSSRPDLIPAETIEELRKLQDAVPAFPFSQVRRVVESDLGGSLEDRFSEFDITPVAAASVAQVHRATLLDGTEVAVKVLRPSVRRRVQDDGRLMLAGARLLELSATARLSDPSGHAQHFFDGILEQTDLRVEAANYRQLQRNFADFEGVSFPAIYRRHSGANVLTMSFVTGTKIDDLGAGDHCGLSKRTRDAFFKMCYEDGFVHADLHPGNMLVRDDGELVLFDAGLCVRLSTEIVRQMVDFAKCIAMGDSDDFVNHLRQFHTYMEDTNWDLVRQDATRFMNQFRNQNTAELEMGVFINEIFAIARRHRIRPLAEVTLVLVGIVTSEGLSKQLDPSANSFQEMAAFLIPIVHKLGLSDDALEQWLKKANESIESIPE